MPAALLAVAALAALVAARESAGGEAVASFRAAFPGARLVAGRHGGLEHASGFADRSGGGEAGARRFLSLHGSAFGVQDAGAGLELLRTVGAPGQPGAVVFRRMVDGLPIFGGEVVVGLSPGGAVSMVNGSPSPAVLRGGSFRASPAAARAAALREGETLAGGVEAGWLEFGGRLFPAYRLRTVAGAFPGVFHAYVDGSSGRLLHRVPLAASAWSCPPCAVPPCICAFQDSPLMPPPPGPDGNPPMSYPALGLPATVPAGGQPPSGVLAAVFNCRGADLSGIPSGCPAQTPSDATGSFLWPPEPTGRDPTDAFAEQSAYFHVDAQSRFFSRLDTAFPGIGFVDGFVNVFDGGAPLDNAFYLPSGSGGGTMVFGQGAQVDMAYDAEIVFHELTHAAIGVTSQFEQYLDTLGVNVDPASASEGTADTFAFANPHVLQPCFAPYVASSQASACLRNADNRRTCRGNGPSDGANPGRTGEPHQDGQIWSGFAWSLFEAAMSRDAVLGSGTRLRDAMTRALFRALETAGSHASFEGYAATVQAQVAADADLGATGADLVACVTAQRDLAGCSDRAVALYSGERAAAVIRGTAPVSPAPQQYFLDVPCGATALHVASGDDTGHGLVLIRYGKPVDFAGPGFEGAHYDWLLPHEEADAVLRAGSAPCPACDACGTRTPLGAGRWYFLPAGLDRAAFWLEVSIEAPAGVALPVRVPYLFGPGQPAGQEVNLCAWGGGRAPQPLRPPAYSAEPDLGSCSPPVAPQVTLPSQCQTPPPPPSSGCDHGPAGPGSILLLLLALRRPRVVSPSC